MDRRGSRTRRHRSRNRRLRRIRFPGFEQPPQGIRLNRCSETSDYRPDYGAYCAGPRESEYAALPLAFEINEGQADPEVKYVARGKDYRLGLKSTKRSCRCRVRSDSPKFAT